MIEQAPFRQLAGDTLEPAAAFWMTADDGVRLRLAAWRSKARSPAGTVLLFPGRTEYIEKYAPIARRFTTEGYEVLSIDWRGQGLSDRLIEDPRPGHVSDFADYQRDVVEMIVAANKIDLPRPWHLLAHSMGGCIGLAALLDDLPVSSVAFSAPMWGIDLHRLPRPLVLALCGAMKLLGQGERATPGTGADGNYLIDETFGTNLLTSDVEEWVRMLREAVAWDDMTIGGASYNWVREALKECARLQDLPSPNLPMIASLGYQEAIVSASAIRTRIAQSPDASLLEFKNCRHEVLMETPDLRLRFMDAVLRQFRMFS